MKRHPPLIDSVIDGRIAEGRWSSDDPSRNDANCVLEALLAEHGVEAAREALTRQGFRGDYRYLLKPLHAEAVRRRAMRQGAAAAEAP